MAFNFAQAMITATGGSQSRSFGAHLADRNNAKNFGATGDGSTDDKTAIDAAAAVGPVYVPDGTYSYPGSNFGAALGSKRFFGEGQVKTGANKRARNFSALTSAPSSYGDPSGIDTAFNGDLSRVQVVMEHRITGAATLTQPTSGYVNKPETAARYGQFYNSSGYNSVTTGNTGGRTMAAFDYLKLSQAGQGDMVGQFMEAYVSSTKAGATHFLANPAVGFWAGQMTAGAAGVYLNPFELNLQSGAFDCAAIGPVVNLTRNVASSALNTYWAGVRIQSKGSQPVDDAFVATGKMNAVLNSLRADLGSTKAVLAMTDGQRIFGNGVQADGSGFAVPSFGNEYLGYDSTKTGWDFGVSGGSVVIGNNQIKVGSNKVIGARGASLPADASDLATAITLVNAIKTGLSAATGHGLFA